MFRRVIGHLLLPAILLPTLFWFWLQGAVRETMRVPVAGAELQVPTGMGLDQLAMQLLEREILTTHLPVKIYARLYGKTAIQAGDYQLKAGESALTLLNKLRSGDVRQFTVTFPEGWTTQQWLEALTKKPNVANTLVGKTPRELAIMLGVAGDSIEGWLAPDTYVYRSGDTDAAILRRAHQRMEAILFKLWQTRADDLPYETPYDALIMASIVEKETSVSEELAQISGVFVRRLRKGMRLQTDPTVIYGLGAAFNGNLTRQHLRKASPYNTYLIDGLPPTPIAHPGIGAVRAALHPAPGDALFFVATGDGRHAFSRTYKEHRQAVQRFQIKHRVRDYRSVPATTGAPQ